MGTVSVLRWGWHPNSFGMTTEQLARINPAFDMTKAQLVMSGVTLQEDVDSD
jgi:hypothetical protein